MAYDKAVLFSCFKTQKSKEKNIFRINNCDWGWFVSDDELEEYKNFLKDIDYIVKEGPNFKISTSNIDEEISTICGPQLVVPITNARFAINAVNARWGSLYDALYGTDAIGEAPKGGGYDRERGDKVVKFAKSHLDKFAPLQESKWIDVNNIHIKNNKVLLSSSKIDNIDFVNTDQLLGWTASIMPSPISLSSLFRIAGVVIK